MHDDFHFPSSHFQLFYSTLYNINLKISYFSGLHQWQPGIEVAPTLVSVKKGQSSKISVQVSNTTHHDLVLGNRTTLGRIQLVRSVTPLEVRQKRKEEWVRRLPWQRHNPQTGQQHERRS